MNEFTNLLTREDIQLLLDVLVDYWNKQDPYEADANGHTRLDVEQVTSVFSSLNRTPRLHGVQLTRLFR